MFDKSDGLKYFYKPIPESSNNETAAWLGYTATYISNKDTIIFNKDTINSLTDFSVKKKLNTYRIFTVGDSFTYGSYMNTKITIHPY